MISGEFLPKNNKELIKGILQSNGYNIKDCGNYLQFPALWRGGNDDSVTLYTDSGQVIDWVTSEKFNVKELLKRVTNINNESIDKYITDNNLNFQKDNEPKIELRKKFPKELLLKISDDYSYALERGVSDITCKLFKCGTVKNSKGIQNNRFIFPIFNNRDEIVGFSGRTLVNDKRKYVISGDKKLFVWPAHLNNSIISKSKCVILVESNFDVLWLWENGIKNVLCLFGTDCNLGIINYLLKRNIEKIIIATNNEPDNNNIGNEAALKIKKKLCKYFDYHNVIIKLPNKKDFNEKNKEEINKWVEELKLQIGNKYFLYD